MNNRINNCCSYFAAFLIVQFSLCSCQWGQVTKNDTLSVHYAVNTALPESDMAKAICDNDAKQLRKLIQKSPGCLSEKHIDSASVRMRPAELACIYQRADMLRIILESDATYLTSNKSKLSHMFFWTRNQRYAQTPEARKECYKVLFELRPNLLECHDFMLSNANWAIRFDDTLCLDYLLEMDTGKTLVLNGEDGNVLLNQAMEWDSKESEEILRKHGASRRKVRPGEAQECCNLDIVGWEYCIEEGLRGGLRGYWGADK